MHRVVVTHVCLSKQCQEYAQVLSNKPSPTVQLLGTQKHVLLHHAARGDQPWAVALPIEPGQILFTMKFLERCSESKIAACEPNTLVEPLFWTQLEKLQYLTKSC